MALVLYHHNTGNGTNTTTWVLQMPVILHGDLYLALSNDVIMV